MKRQYRFDGDSPQPKRRKIEYKNIEKIIILLDDLTKYENIEDTDLKISVNYITSWDYCIVNAGINIYDGLRFSIGHLTSNSRYIIDARIENRKILWRVRKMNSLDYIVMSDIKIDKLYDLIFIHKHKINKILNYFIPE